MSPRHPLRVTAALGGLALGAGLLLAPATAQAAPLLAEGEATSCTVTGGELVWGIKESFRSYISGSIANGSWETSDGAVYELPDFIWSSPTGAIDPATGTGTVTFPGAVHFTGHDGVLDLVLANPTIEFEGDGKAALMLDSRSNDMEGNVAIDAKQEWVGALAVPAELGVSEGVLQLDELPAELTNSGAAAFAGFYEAGAELDPVSIRLETEGCADIAAASATADDGEQQEVVAPAAPVETSSAPMPWLPIGIGAVALVVIGVTTGMLIGGRKRAPEGGAAE